MDVVLEQADQMHAAANAFIKGIASTPVQPQLHRTRQLAQHADSMVVLAHGADVSGKRGVAGLPLLRLRLRPLQRSAATGAALVTRCMLCTPGSRCRLCRGWAARCLS